MPAIWLLLVIAAALGRLVKVYNTLQGSMQNIRAGHAGGLAGNGYGWNALAQAFWPNAAGLGAEPEAGLFCVYSDNRETVRESARAFKAACEDNALIRNLLSRAEGRYGQREAT